MSEKLLVANNYHLDIILNLEKPISPRRKHPIGCAVPAGGVKDITGLLGLPYHESRRIVEASPDYWYYFNRSRALMIIEDSAPPEVVEPPKIVPHEGPVGGDPTPPEPSSLVENPVMLRVINQVRAMQQLKDIEERSLDSVRELPHEYTPETAPKIEEVEDVKVTEALEPGAADLLSDMLPSSRWSKERLAEHAKGRGVDVTGMSKNAILRALRNL